MKYFFLALLVTVPVILAAQTKSKLNYIDPVKVYQEALDEYGNGNYDKALMLIDQIDENDSVYIFAMSTKASILLDNEKHDEVISLCDYFLNQPVKNAYPFYINKGVAQLREEKHQDAINTFIEALENYPMSYLVYYNMAIGYEKLEQYEKAISAHQKSIILNPYYASPHLRLAWICYNENLITQAVMCWNMYLLLEPTASNSLNVLVALNNAVSEKNDSEPKNIKVSEDDDAFEEIDLIVNNYAALNKEYKIDNKIAIPAVKQNHAIMEKLSELEGNGDFWSEKYVPFYLSLFKAGYFNDFIYRILQSTTVEKYQKIISKNSGNQKEFLGWAGETWTNICGNDNSRFWGEDIDNFFYLSSGVVSAIGKRNATGELEGSFHFYNSNGSKLSEGYFTNGKRDKNWTWYREDQSLDTKATYKDGSYNGYYVDYYKNGRKKFETNYKNDYYQDTLRRYTIYGAMTEESEYNEGVLSGYTIVNHELGEGFPKYHLRYKNDKYDSIATEYFPSGETKLVMNFDEGIHLGEEKHYFRTGEISYVYNYENDMLNGNYQSLYRDGKLHQEGQYTDDYKTGLWKTYYPNGNLSAEENFDEKGRLSGIYKSYTEDGELYLEYEYNKDDLIAYKYFDKEGKVLVDERKQNQKFNYRGYHANSVPSLTGVYTIEGKKEGTWNYYNIYGGLISSEAFEDGKMVDQDEEYFLDGSLSEITRYKDGVIDGYYESYYIDGTYHMEGYYQDGEGERTWLYYYPDGSLMEKRYFKDDNRTGYNYTYSIEGNLYEKKYYEDNLLHFIVYYDSLGNYVDSLNLLTAREKTFYYPDGKIRSVQSYLNGYAHGSYIWYHYNGKKETEGEFFFGSRNGTWRWWNDEGQLIRETEYEHGNHHGTMKFYHANGELHSIQTYVNDEQHGWNIEFSESSDTTYKAFYQYDEVEGPAYYYSDNGELHLVRYYKHGELIGYSYPDSSGKLVNMIPIEKGTGKIISYYRNGNKAREIEFLQGEFNGKYYTYHANGNLAETTEYLAGYRHGEDLEYYSDNQLKAKSYYLNDERHGAFLKYHTNGRLAESVQYRNGGKTGYANYYDEQGKLLKKILYYNDEVIKATYFE